jgi:DNA-binding ferritin-like protein (Dps family)
MPNILKRIREDKKEYRRQMEKVKALPADYRFVYEKIQGYMWSFAGGNGLDMLNTQYDLIELFEAGAAEGKHVLDITGKDVAGFCDGLIRDNKLWTDRRRKKMNRDMKKRLEKGGDSPLV